MIQAKLRCSRQLTFGHPAAKSFHYFILVLHGDLSRWWRITICQTQPESPQNVRVQCVIGLMLHPCKQMEGQKRHCSKYLCGGFRSHHAESDVNPMAFCRQILNCCSRMNTVGQKFIWRHLPSEETLDTTKNCLVITWKSYWHCIEHLGEGSNRLFFLKNATYIPQNDSRGAVTHTK